jgi:hypothetical protein
VPQLSVNAHKVLGAYGHACADEEAATALSLVQLQLQRRLPLLAALAQLVLQGKVGCTLANHVAAASIWLVQDGS